ncbi:MAG: hypothetical protein MUE46_04270 [Xanthomonadales bacterium]|jgi:hypothetical protein|nr:hypothetical protein [Xanthomonadales bacterium]
MIAYPRPWHWLAVLTTWVAAMWVPPLAAGTSPEPCCSALASIRAEFLRVAQLARAAAQGEAGAADRARSASAALAGMSYPALSCPDDDTLGRYAIDAARQLADSIDRGAGLIGHKDPWPAQHKAQTTMKSALRDARAGLAAASGAQAGSGPRSMPADVDTLDARLAALEIELPRLFDTDLRARLQGSAASWALLAALRQDIASLRADASVTGPAWAAALDGSTEAAAAVEHAMDRADAVSTTMSAWMQNAEMLERSLVVAGMEPDGLLEALCPAH